jgi:predicted transcriptional regulator
MALYRTFIGHIFIKENYIKSFIGHFIFYIGHISDIFKTMKHINITSQVRRYENVENSVIFKIFGNDPVLVYIFRKVARISAAIHLISDYLSDTNPFKQKIRQASIDLLDKIGDIVFWGSSFDRRSEEFGNLLVKTAAFLEVGYIAGMITEMNFSLIKSEIYACFGQMEQVAKNLSKNPKFQVSANLFNISPVIVSSEEKRTTDFAGGIFEGAAQRSDFVSSVSSGLHYKKQKIPAIVSEKAGNRNVLSKQMSDKMSDINVRYSDDKGHLSVGKGQDREELIIKVISANKEMTISEISSHFPNLSVKTIQRMVNSLVGKGILRKEGEKRWRRYFISTQNRVNDN